VRFDGNLTGVLIITYEIITQGFGNIALNVLII